jgi:hypothetical protein
MLQLKAMIMCCTLIGQAGTECSVLTFSSSFQAQQPLEKYLCSNPFISVPLYCHVLVTGHGGNVTVFTWTVSFFKLGQEKWL